MDEQKTIKGLEKVSTPLLSEKKLDIPLMDFINKTDIISNKIVKSGYKL